MLLFFIEVTYMKFSLKLKELRENRGLTQRDLAQALKLSKGSVGMWESTERLPNAKQLQQISNYFDVSIDELLGREDFTHEERAAGAMATRKESITPLEDDLLYVFRQIGKRYGEQAQRDFVTVGENMLKLK